MTSTTYKLGYSLVSRLSLVISTKPQGAGDVTMATNRKEGDISMVLRRVIIKGVIITGDNKRRVIIKMKFHQSSFTICLQFELI